MKKTQIRITTLSFSYDDKDIINNMNLVINQRQRICLLGENGQGKSTLLKLIQRQLPPSTGSINVDGDIMYLEQDIDNKDQSVYDYLMHFVQPREEYKILIALDDSGCTFDYTKKISELSGGQQTKVRLAALSLIHSSILILDEPTNHLDEDGVKQVKEIVMNYDGIVIIVSHDRWFINEVATHCLELHEGETTLYTGNYQAYEEQKQARYERMMQEFQLQERKRKQFENWLAMMRQRASVYVNPARGRLIRSREKMYQREFVDKQKDKPTKNSRLSLTGSGGVHAGKLLFALKDLTLGHDSMILLNKINCEMRGQQRVLLSGSNGSGKTSLLSHIMENREYHNDPAVKRGTNLKVAYFTQHDDLTHETMPVYQRYIRHVRDNRLEYQIISALSKLGIESHHVHKPLSVLSYGQRVKLKFLSMTSKPHDLLVLDEPTNHLDISTRESLESMLNRYQGAILLVSHDKRFAGNIRVTDVWHIEEKKVIKETS